MNNYLNIPGIGSGGGSGTWKAPVADFASLPGSGNTAGDARITLDLLTMYVWSGSAWVPDTAVDTNAIYRNNTQPPTQDISWANFGLLNFSYLQSSSGSGTNFGTLKLGNSEYVSWQRGAADGTNALYVDNSNFLSYYDWNYDDNVVRVGFESNTSVLQLYDGSSGVKLNLGSPSALATSGRINLPNNSDIAWRGSFNNVDASIALDGSNNFVFTGIFNNNTSSELGVWSMGPYSTGSILRLTGGTGGGSSSKMISAIYMSNARETNDPGVNTTGLNLYYGEQISWSGLQLSSIYSGLHLNNSGTAFLWVDDSLQAANYFQHGDAFAPAASSGALRLQKHDAIAWRNEAGSGNNTLVTDTSDDLLYNGVSLTSNIAPVTFTMVDGQASPADVVTFSTASYTSVQIDYSISRGTGNAESGTLYLVSDASATAAGISQNLASIGSSNVTFTADVTGGTTLRLRYTSVNTGTVPVMKYTIKKWLA